MRNLKRSLLTVILVLSLILTSIPVFAAGTGAGGMDVVVVIDTSGSMKFTDSQRIALDAAILFVEMMACDGSRVGLVSFSDQLGAVVNLTSINSPADKDSVINSISNLNYSEDTDIGLAVQKAMEILQAGGDVGNGKMILFLTDGAIDLPDAADPAQAAADSRAMAETATQNAAAAGIPIYTIGLDGSAQDAAYHLDEALISQMAASTNGTYNKVTSSGQLPKIFDKIFANFRDSEIIPGPTVTLQDSNTPEDIGFTVPNSSVMEANVILHTSQRLTEVSLSDPSGALLPVTDPKVNLNIRDHHSLVKLFAPQAGDWTLHVKGAAGCTVECQWLFNYDNMILKASAAATADGAAITAYFESKGQPVTDDAVYQEFTTVKARVTDQSGAVTEYPMSYTPGSAQFTGDIKINPGETVTVVVDALEGTTMTQRESDPLTVNGPPLLPETEAVVTPALSDPIVLKGLLPNLAKAKINLDDCVTTTSGNALSYTAQTADPAVAEAELNGSDLVLKGAKKGTTTLTVEASDPSGVTNSQTVSVEVQAVFGSILPLILIPVILLLLIIVIIIIIKARPKKPAGNLYWHLEYEDSYGDSDDEEHILGMNGSKELLSTIVMDPAVAFVDLNKIEITGVKRGGGILVKSAAKKCTLNDSMGGTARRLQVREEDEFSVVCDTDDGEVTIRCYYSTQERDDY